MKQYNQKHSNENIQTATEGIRRAFKNLETFEGSKAREGGLSREGEVRPRLMKILVARFGGNSVSPVWREIMREYRSRVSASDHPRRIRGGIHFSIRRCVCWGMKFRCGGRAQAASVFSPRARRRMAHELFIGHRGPPSASGRYTLEGIEGR